MGVSTDGILYYGLCWSEEGEPVAPRMEGDPPEGDDENEEEYDENVPVFGSDEDFEDRLNRRLGGPAHPVWNDALNKYEGDLGEYWKARDAFLLDKLGAKVGEVRHCSGDYPLWGLAIESTHTKARRGYPQKIADFVVPEGSDDVLRKACAALGIDFDVEAAQGRLGWWVTSLWW